MSTTTKEIFEKNNWKCTVKSDGVTPDYFFLENTETGFCDYPIRDSRGKVVYDYPEKIPEYVHELCSKHL